MDEKKLGRGGGRVEPKAEEEAGERAPYFDGLDTQTAILARLRELAAQGTELVGGSGRYPPLDMIEPVEVAFDELPRRKIDWEAPDTQEYVEKAVRSRYGVTTANGLRDAVVRGIFRLASEGKSRDEAADQGKSMSFSDAQTESELGQQLREMAARGEVLQGSKKTYHPRELLFLVDKALTEHADFDPTQEGAFDKLEENLRIITQTAGLRDAVRHVILNKRGQ